MTQEFFIFCNSVSTYYEFVFNFYLFAFLSSQSVFPGLCLALKLVGAQSRQVISRFKLLSFQKNLHHVNILMCNSYEQFLQCSNCFDSEVASPVFFSCGNVANTNENVSLSLQIVNTSLNTDCSQHWCKQGKQNTRNGTQTQTRRQSLFAPVFDYKALQALGNGETGKVQNQRRRSKQS